MDKRKRQRKVARGTARWHASRLEGVRKNRGIRKEMKQKGTHTERRFRKVVRVRASKKRKSHDMYDL